MVVEHNRKITWRHPVRDLRDTPLEGCCGETMELEGRDPTISTPPHLPRHLKAIHEKELFWLEKCRKMVRSYDTTRP